LIRSIVEDEKALSKCDEGDNVHQPIFYLKDGEYTQVELLTPLQEEDILQSADVGVYSGLTSSGVVALGDHPRPPV
jgi:hypothetical protein